MGACGCLIAQLCPTLCNPLDCSPSGSSVHGILQTSTGVGCHCLLTSMKGEINNNAIIVGDFNTPLTPMDRSTKQKINKETQTLNDTIDQLDLIDIYRTFHPKTMTFTFFSSAHGTFSSLDHILGHKSSLGKFKKKKKRNNSKHLF